MSPEQVRGDSVDSRSDIFALGVILYKMVIGKTAFRKPTKADTISANSTSNNVSSIFEAKADVVSVSLLRSLDAR